MRIDTLRLYLRPVRLADVDYYYEMHSDPQFAKYWSEPAWTARKAAVNRVKFLMESHKKGTCLPLSIFFKDSDEFVGICSLFNYNVPCRRAEIGYGIMPTHWGHGLATEAVGDLIDYGFKSQNLHRIEADIDPDNVASAKVLLNLGFSMEGHLRERWIVGGKTADTAFYGLLQRDWKR